MFFFFQKLKVFSNYSHDLSVTPSGSNTLNSTLRQVALACGISFGAILLHFSAHYHDHGDEYQVSDFQLTFQIIALIGVVAGIDFFSIKKTDGLNVRNKKVS